MSAITIMQQLSYNLPTAIKIKALRLTIMPITNPNLTKDAGMGRLFG
jgi:hypothetical protein